MATKRHAPMPVAGAKVEVAEVAGAVKAVAAGAAAEASAVADSNPPLPYLKKEKFTLP